MQAVCEKRLSARPPAQSDPDVLAEALDCGLTFTTGATYDQDGWQWTNGWPSYQDDDCAAGTTGHNGEGWMQTTVSGAGTLKFWWKVSSGAGDYLESLIDDQPQQDAQISGGQDWDDRNYTVSDSGSHTLRWRYVKDSEDFSSEDEDCGRVDWVRWQGNCIVNHFPKGDRL
jgi:hypothetical protein